MSRRIVTAREQSEMLLPWRTSGKYYHITDDPNFKVNPDYRPEINTTLGGDSHIPGIFVADNPGSWFHGHQYHRPYVAEFDVPDDVFGREDSRNKGYRNEKFIPSKYFNDIKHTRTIPYDAYVREEYGSYGPTESSSGKDFLTGEPITPSKNGQKDFPKGYQYSDNDTTRNPEWIQNYKNLMDQYHRADGSEFSGGWDNYKDPRMGTYAWDEYGDKAWYHPATGKYHRRPNVSFRGVEVDAEPHEFSKTPWDQAENHDENEEGWW